MKPADQHRALPGCGWLSVVVSLALAGSTNAESPERWRVHPSVGLLEGVALRIHWFGSTEELRDAARDSGQQINEFGLKGFSILKRNKETGEYVCDLYAVEVIGTHIDGHGTTVFGHEVLHCFGLKHD